MLRAICAVESISVPSQSKTIRSNCCRAMRVRLVIRGGAGRILPVQLGKLCNKAPALVRPRRLKLQRLAGRRVRDLEPVRMQKHALDTGHGIRARQRLVQREIAILRVADDRQSQMSQMDAYLMGATRFQFRLE